MFVVCNNVQETIATAMLFGNNFNKIKSSLLTMSVSLEQLHNNIFFGFNCTMPNVIP